MTKTNWKVQASKSYYDFQSEGIDCITSHTPCMMHRYKTVYICGCGKLISHSQGDWNEHRLHPNGISLPSDYYVHGDTASSLFDRMNVFGFLPYGTPEFERIYMLAAEEKLK